MRRWRLLLSVPLLTVGLVAGCGTDQSGLEKPLSPDPDDATAYGITGIEIAEAEYLARLREADGGVEFRTQPCPAQAAPDGAQWCPEELEEPETVWIDIPVPISDDDTPNDEMDPPDDW